MDLCYLISMPRRQLPSHMQVGDPLGDASWDLLLAAFVMVREEEEPKVGGGCWLWSILEPRVHIPRIPPGLTAPGLTLPRVHGHGLTAPELTPRAHGRGLTAPGLTPSPGLSRP